MRRLRIFTAFFVGYMVYFFLYAFIAWALTFLKLTPYGRFVSTFFKGRKPEEAQAAIEASRELFNEMLPQAVVFSNLVMMPSVGFVMGLTMGLITAEKGHTVKTGALWSFIAAIPIGIFFWVKSAAVPGRELYFLMFLLITVAGGVLGGLMASKTYAKE